jgi:hypothetical protein
LVEVSGQSGEKIRPLGNKILPLFYLNFLKACGVKNLKNYLCLYAWQKYNISRFTYRIKENKRRKTNLEEVRPLIGSFCNKISRNSAADGSSRASASRQHCPFLANFLQPFGKEKGSILTDTKTFE